MNTTHSGLRAVLLATSLVAGAGLAGAAGAIAASAIAARHGPHRRRFMTDASWSSGNSFLHPSHVAIAVASLPVLSTAE